MQFIDVANYVRNLGLGPHEQRRIDCPACGGANCFSVSCSLDGWLKFNCFRASCSHTTKGSIRMDPTVKNIKAILEKKEEKREPKKFKLPGSFTVLPRDKRVVDYLLGFNIAKAYLERRASIMWDVRQERIVFLCTYNNMIVNASGRAIEKGVKPKWYNYGSYNVGFFVPMSLTVRTEECILVEDAASACSASNVMDTLALCGTGLTPEHVNVLKKYKKVYIVLDADARKTALKLHNKLYSSGIFCKVIYTTDDLKYFKTPEIKKIIRHGKKATEKFVTSPFL